MYVFCSVSDSLPSSRHATAWPQTSPKVTCLFLVLVISIFKLDIGSIPSGTLPFLLTRRSSPCSTPGHPVHGRITLQRNIFFVRTHNFPLHFSLKGLKMHALSRPYPSTAPAFPFSLFFTMAGQPAARESSGISFTTTLPAAMTQRFPMVTPGQTTTPPPNQQSSPMVMG